MSKVIDKAKTADIQPKNTTCLVIQPRGTKRQTLYNKEFTLNYSDASFSSFFTEIDGHKEAVMVLELR